MRLLASFCAGLAFLFPLGTTQIVMSDEVPADAQAKSPERLLVTLSEETTRIVKPLREDGYPDYVAALDQRASDGVTAENNSAVLLWQVVGPEELSEDISDEYFRRLGIKPLPENGVYMKSYYAYLEDVLPDDVDRRSNEYERFEQARRKPWTRQDNPVMADWIDAQAKYFKLLVEASERTRYYSPVVSGESDGNPPLIAVLLPAIGHVRNAGRQLVARAMLRLGEGDVEGAWSDLLACHRLARLARQGHTLVDSLVGAAVDAEAWHGVTALAVHGKLTPAQTIRFRTQLDALPPMVPMADKVDVGERFMFLDCVCMLARAGSKAFEVIRKWTVDIGNLSNDMNPIVTFTSDANEADPVEQLERNLAGTVIDYDEVLRMGNAFYDRLVKAGRIENAKQRADAFAAMDRDMKKRLRSVKRGALGTPLLALGGQQGKKMLGRQVGTVLLGLLVPALKAAFDVEYRTATQFRMEQLSLALAAYHSDQKGYPEKLGDLVPKYLANVPRDAFSGAEFRYRPLQDDYVLYSVGANGNDEQGRGRADDAPGDDIAIQTSDIR